MPFVPLGSRRNVGVILDDDKERIVGKMREKDNATVTLHHQVMMAQNSSYRYARHPTTMGPVRGPAPPFKTANKPWTPAEHDPNGMAAMRDLDQAPVGAVRDGGHCFFGETLRKTRSTPALTRTLAASPIDAAGRSLGEQAKEAANPISIELNRWKRLAEVTKRDLASMPELHSNQPRDVPPPKKPIVTNGLVNFPKYMLFENSHMKSMDFMRFVAAEDKARAEVEEKHAREAAIARGESVQDLSPTSTGRDSFSSSAPNPWPPRASWGEPRTLDPKKHWAGNPMPTGKNTRSSNPFRN